MLPGLFAAPVAAQQDVPANMVLIGTVVASDAVAPLPRDLVLVVDDDGLVQGQGTIRDLSGAFGLEMSKPASFNGTRLSLRLRQSDGVEYHLLVGGRPFQFQYNGSLFPTRLNINAMIGQRTDAPSTPPAGGGDPAPGDGQGGGTSGGGTSGGGTSGGGTSGGGTSGGGAGSGDGGGGTPGGGLSGRFARFDVNGDAVFDQRDVDFIKRVVAGGGGADNGRADVNGDGMVNTRDIIEAIKALRSSRRPGANSQ